jgi:hypothetical protein
METEIVDGLENTIPFFPIILIVLNLSNYA